MSCAYFLFTLVLSNARAADLSLYHSDHLKTSQYDPGSLRVFFVNNGENPVAIEYVLLDDIIR